MEEKKLCFVISPIGEDDSDTRKRSDKILRHVIRPAVEACGYEAVRADGIDRPGNITSHVLQKIVEAPLVVADLTDYNPNVFYELAIRHALKTPLVQIIRKGDKVPFDIYSTRTVPVDETDLDNVDEAKKAIERQIKSLEENPDIETPISKVLDTLSLQGSAKPGERSLADLIVSVGDLQSSLVMKIGNKDQPGLLDEIKKQLGTISSSLGIDPNDKVATDFSEYHSRLNKLYATPFLRPVLTQLTNYEKLFDRVQEGVDLKKGLAQFFWNYCFTGIYEAKAFRLFFESGSTIAYVADRFLQEAASNQSWKDYLSNVNVTTNNLLVYLQFLFTSPATSAEMRPSGRPDEKYGAIYGPIDELVTCNPPNEDIPNERTRKCIDSVRNLIASPTLAGSSSIKNAQLLILAAASGVSYANEPLGPHVGSFRNQIFKRALLQTEAPIIFFVDESKYLDPKNFYSPTRCYAVCGKLLPWSEVVKNRAIAFCVSASGEHNRRTIAKALKELGLGMSSSSKLPGSYVGHFPFLVANTKFAEQFSAIRLGEIERSGLLD